ncbi:MULTISPECIES: TIGR00266 family protein [unclassified Breznakia]|uniref:TIGR00266 family protein n=1 Tax=unclassified Breznakia TaxID=2623764 RepID=UPI0024747C3E|nr:MULTISPECIES: TIGR00266 family protein [unclassified Breznakia]MDH6366749.1 uncharacterized protein (TIGR00266 family) [Breznakia sp. PH1-1]MDH6403864.1 uncharacterized protein (TIGR00266 family) [Breznakia sp. PF1-11]MDH6411573.1 uncharacterized protein (TIGR00266 family) [Breznakia sp. PFB1-11]MDH6413937.1 uncharacterized protein (TIGR00266 family) [Breznakia sp. PFB1-14]MDH6416366.1 uncharacterized protein (TIGR00266 family) [Breznakia sp. PFB1-4]
MKYTKTSSTAFPLVEIQLQANEVVRIERGAMAYHNGKVNLEGKMNSNGSTGIGGLLKAVGRSVVSGESMFITTVTGLADDAKIGIAPNAPGEIREIQVSGQNQWRLNDSAFFACDEGVSYDMERQSFGKAVFGRTGGFFVMTTKGEGSMLISSYGDILEFELDGTQPFVVDNSHVVAWNTSLNYEIKVASGTFGFKSGEGLVNEFNGVGKVLVQTRNIEALASIIDPYIVKGN